jgi:hypothetical protein
VRPWEFVIKLSQLELTQRITYKYSIKNDKEDYTIWEREPSRYAQIGLPHLYQG